jgi:pescadillo
MGGGKTKTKKDGGADPRRKKAKPKSIKAKVTSKFSAKRLLSRHGKQQKKGMAGPGTDFVTRSQALKKLQITLKDFRRLCILKGIYPRVPPTKAPKGQDKVYYDIKDLSHLTHEPLLQKFRDFKSFMKKIRRASGRNEFEEARRKDELKPHMALDHLVKERYPRFIDALRDLDDALCMMHLFAAMPSKGRITAAHTSTCNELVRHWQYYVARSHSLNKVFVSVKGTYFQAGVMGEQVTWLVPHRFTQQVPKEVDLRVMLTFLDFYEVFVRFVLFKLYAMLELQYPPVIDKQLDAAGCSLLAIRPAEVELAPEQGNAGAMVTEALHLSSDEPEEETEESAEEEAASKAKKGKVARKADTAALDAMQSRLKSLNQKLSGLSEADEFEGADGEDDDLQEPVPVEALTEAFRDFEEDKNEFVGDDERKTFAASSGERAEKHALLSGMRFFCNREVPLEWLQLCVIAFGGQIGWEGQASPFQASDPSITHHVVDRPMDKKGLLKGREYVQPQWVFDSINAQVLIPVGKYAPGSKLPPHLSPFVDDSKEGYMPKYREEILAIQRAAGVGGSSSIPTKAQEKESLGDDSEEESEEDENESASGKRKRTDPEETPQQLDANTKRSKGSKGVVYAANIKQQTEVREHIPVISILFFALNSYKKCFTIFPAVLKGAYVLLGRREVVPLVDCGLDYLGGISLWVLCDAFSLVVSTSLNGL